jgi:hypothetical protein
MLAEVKLKNLKLTLCCKSVYSASQLPRNRPLYNIVKKNLGIW